MKLITKELERRLAAVGSREDDPDPIIVARFFNPVERVFYGYVSIFGDHNDKWGCFSLAELESYKGPLDLGIERDLYFTEKWFSQEGKK